MRDRIHDIITTLNSNIHVGERYEKNLRNIAVISGIVMVLGLVMALVNLAQDQITMALTCLLILAAGAVGYVSVKRYGKRAGATIAGAIAIVGVLTYDVLFANYGFAFIWTLLVTLALCYKFSVRMGIAVTGYFQLLFIALFYTPQRRFMAPYYSQIAMNRFPLLYFFHSLMVLYFMYQYQKSVLFEIGHTDKLNEEAAKPPSSRPCGRRAAASYSMTWTTSRRSTT